MTHEEFFSEQMKDPEFAKAYEESEEEFKGDVAKFDFCRISTSPFSYSFFWLSRLAAIFFAS